MCYAEKLMTGERDISQKAGRQRRCRCW